MAAEAHPGKVRPEAVTVGDTTEIGSRRAHGGLRQGMNREPAAVSYIGRSQPGDPIEDGPEQLPGHGHPPSRRQTRRPLHARSGGQVHARAPSFKFWDHKHLVASAKDIDDMRIKVRRNGTPLFCTTAPHAR